MKTLILGAGKVGLGIAQHLVEQGMEVLLLDKSPQVVNYVKHFTQIPILQGNALDINVLNSVFLNEPGYIVSTLPRDEENIIACKIIGSHFNVSTKIARIRSKIFTKDKSFQLFIKNSFNIDKIIQPEIEVANYIENIVPIRNISDVSYLSNIVIVSLKCIDNTEILNTPMKNFENITDLPFYILNISRNGRMFFPVNDDILSPGDEIYFATHKEYLSEILRLFGYSPDYNQNILVVGGGRIGETLIDHLSEYQSIKLHLIEKSRDKANEIAQKFPKLMVMPGDAQNYKFLQDVASNMDTAIIATDDEKINVITALFLKKLGVSRIFVLSNNKDYEQLLSSTGCFVVNPNAITVNNMVKLSYSIKNLEITTIANIGYVMKSNISENSHLIGKTIDYITIKNHITPIFIINNDKIHRAKHEYKIENGDTIISFISKDSFTKAEKIFSN